MTLKFHSIKTGKKSSCKCTSGSCFIDFNKKKNFKNYIETHVYARLCHSDRKNVTRCLTSFHSELFKNKTCASTLYLKELTILVALPEHRRI